MPREVGVDGEVSGDGVGAKVPVGGCVDGADSDMAVQPPWGVYVDVEGPIRPSSPGEV